MMNSKLKSDINEIPQNTLRDYLNLIKRNILSILLITVTIVSGAGIYILVSDDIYVANTTLKITQNQKNILDKSIFSGELTDFRANRFIANEILLMSNVTIREQVAREIIDSFKVINRPSDFDLILDKDKSSNNYKLKSYQSLAGLLADKVTITQKEGLDFIEISVESTSPKEAALIANAYANAYRKFNLLDNRQQVSNIKNFLYHQRQEKLKELAESEDRVSQFKLKNSAVKLDKQASSLIDDLTEFESKRNALKIELSILKEALTNYKSELNKKDPSITDYLMNKSAEPYINRIQEEIARIQAQKTIALANKKTAIQKRALLEKYDTQIESLTKELNNSLKDFSDVIYTSSPDEIKDLTKKIFETEVQYRSKLASYNELNKVLYSYESKFNKLPKRTLELARLEREQMANEKLYSMIEEKYQEALINEQAITGNVLIMNSARVPSTPAKPNRQVIIFLSIFGGLSLGFAFVYIRNFFDRTIKSPDDLIDNGINLLAWIPKIKAIKKVKDSRGEIVVENKDNFQAAEAFKTLRTRIQFSKLNSSMKVILLTSTAPGEGKTFVAANLAASLAMANKRTVVIDCDLRKPRLHKLFNSKENRGLTNYFFGKLDYEKLVRPTGIKNLDYIASGMIPPNPSEIICSNSLKTFLLRLRSEYEYIIIDSPPLLAVSDAEVLSRLADGSILVSKSNETEIEWVENAVSLLNDSGNAFIGVILNQFNYKAGYNTYYKYYGYYESNKPKNKKIAAKKLQSV